MLHFLLEQIVLSDGFTLELAADDIVAIVGPNNSGKSEALRGIRNKLQDSNIKNPVVQSVKVDRGGTIGDLRQWLEQHTRKVDTPVTNPQYQSMGATVHENQLPGLWIPSATGLQNLTPFFCRLLNAEERLRAADPAGNIAIARDALSHPIHYMQRFDMIEAKLSDQFHKAFGVDLIVHRNAGNEVPLHVGPRADLPSGVDRTSYEYISELEQLPALKQQGDGMRSFAGVLLYTSIGSESILLVDEPEAFLHPPQARMLGQMLVQDKQVNRQLFVATHSGDVLRGILDSGSKNVRVVRLRREGNINVVHQLENKDIAQLWSDPLLRYSDILDGLFHEKVIVTEGDADARFYSAIAENMDFAQGLNGKRPSIKYTHCGGKARIATLVRALKAVDVPVLAVADFDVLNDGHVLKSIVEASQGEWDIIEPNWKIVKAAIDGRKPDFTSDEVKKEIAEILAGVSAPIFPDDARSRIKKVFQRSTPWANAKAAGKNYVPNGDPSVSYARLVEDLKAMGIFIVEVGELENFYKQASNHGPKWVNQVLQLNLSADPELQEARAFVKELVLWNPNPKVVARTEVGEVVETVATEGDGVAG